MGNRSFTNAVAGGHAARFVPIEHDPSSIIRYNELAIHAQGRTQAMAEILHHCVYLKSAGLMSESAVISSAGARYQDFTGGSGLVAAHRAVSAVLIDGQTTARLPVSLSYPIFRDRMIAPQARTDMIQTVANYADCLFEAEAIAPTLNVIRSALSWQPVSAPVERNMLSDSIHQLQETYSAAYTRAIETYEGRIAEKGYVEHRIGSGPINLPGFANAEIVIDDEAISLASRHRPSHELWAPQIILISQKEAAAQTQPDLVSSDVIAEASEDLDRARSTS